MKNEVKIIATTASAAVTAATAATTAAVLKKKMKKGYCPACEARKALNKLKLTQVAKSDYDNGVALTPPMGWSSWNCFHNVISEAAIKEIALAMEKSGLRDAGYQYVNIDDCWQASERDSHGRLQCDKQTFPSGIRALSDFVNEHGFKLGLYSSNGTLTCEDFPASLRHEAMDADSLAEWGVEYFKYDYCHHVFISTEAPQICYFEIADMNGNLIEAYTPHDVELSGYARILEGKKENNPSGYYITGLSAASGKITLKTTVPASGDYVFTITCPKQPGDEKFLMLETCGKEYHIYAVPSTNVYHGVRRVQTVIGLEEGENTIVLHNPVVSKMDSAAIQYKLMGRELKRAAKEYAEKTGTEVKPIVFSLCEWGANKPYKWGREAGNLWRTTGDIIPVWESILAIYEHNVKLWKYATKGGWNDPDMLEVGNGKLTYDQNVAHFSLWSMMCAPLILGNDVRKFILSDGSVDTKNKTLKILTNKDIIAINQDELGMQARRINAGSVDILVKPLVGGRVAVCAFNKTRTSQKYKINLEKIANLGYVSLAKKETYDVKDVWKDETFTQSGDLKGKLPGTSVKVFIVE